MRPFDLALYVDVFPLVVIYLPEASDRHLTPFQIPWHRSGI